MIFANEDIAKVINVAVAPVFLLTGISGALNVLSIRLGRIIDRGRKLNEEQLVPGSPHAEEVDHEQRQLAIRALLIQRAIMACTVSALFICMVIIALFVEVLLNFQLQLFVVIMFMMALVCLSYGLITFLREIDMSALSFRFGKYRVPRHMKKSG
jgi:hypothetical protein